MIRVGHVFVGAIFPIAEALLVNAVSDAMNGTAPYIMALVVVGIVHAILFFALLFVETPLPQLLVELDGQAQELRRVRTEEQTYKADNATLMGAVTAVQVSLISLEDMRSRPERDLEKLFERVLFPWVVDRSALFGFESDALHNFAVYLRSETDESLLEVRYRVHDDRISPTNRIWRSGDGHVGTCFLRKEMIFFSDEEMDGAGEYAVTS